MQNRRLIYSTLLFLLHLSIAFGRRELNNVVISRIAILVYGVSFIVFIVLGLRMQREECSFVNLFGVALRFASPYLLLTAAADIFLYKHFTGNWAYTLNLFNTLSVHLFVMLLTVAVVSFVRWRSKTAS